MFRLIIDEKTYLRKVELRGAREQFELIDQSREHLRQWMSWVDSTKSIADVENFIKSEKLKDSSDSGYTAVIVYEGRIAGVVSYVTLNHYQKQAEIGYWLGAQYTGKGLMTKACRALIENAFDNLGLNRIQIRAATGNYPSQTVAERLGFTREGVIRDGERLGERYVDLVLYGLLRREYQACR